METRLFRGLIAAVGAGFALAFCGVVIPGLIAQPDVFAAFGAGFVNPFASGYAMDTIACWCALTIWVLHERKARGVRHGWIAIALGVVPGVATGLCVYLLLRMKHDASPA